MTVSKIHFREKNYFTDPYYFYLFWGVTYIKYFIWTKNDWVMDPKKIWLSISHLKKGRGATNKMSVFTIQETFVLSSICQKCWGFEYPPPPPTLNFGTYLPPLRLYTSHFYITLNFYSWFQEPVYSEMRKEWLWSFKWKSFIHL